MGDTYITYSRGVYSDRVFFFIITDVFQVAMDNKKHTNNNAGNVGGLARTADDSVWLDR